MILKVTKKFAVVFSSNHVERGFYYVFSKNFHASHVSNIVQYIPNATRASLNEVFGVNCRRNFLQYIPVPMMHMWIVVTIEMPCKMLTNQAYLYGLN